MPDGLPGIFGDEFFSDQPWRPRAPSGLVGSDKIRLQTLPELEPLISTRRTASRRVAAARRADEQGLFPAYCARPEPLFCNDSRCW